MVKIIKKHNSILNAINFNGIKTKLKEKLNSIINNKSSKNKLKNNDTFNKHFLLFFFNI